MNLDLYRYPGEPEPQPPAVGDIILTARLAKLVTEVRPVESKVWHHRWRLTTTNIGRNTDSEVRAEVRRRQAEGADVRTVGHYENHETPVDHALVRGYQVEAG